MDMSSTATHDVDSKLTSLWSYILMLLVWGDTANNNVMVFSLT